MKLLLSIKPEYAKRIISGEKRYEFRKRLPQKRVDSIIIYATAPVKSVVGEVEVIDTLTMRPTPLWENTKVAAGISRSKYREYFHGCKEANAFVLGTVIEYTKTKSLSDYGLENAPQSFVYINENEYE